MPDTLRLRQIYNDYRTASLNRKYYGIKLHRLRKWSLWMEILIAVGTASAAGFTLLQNPVGNDIWKVIVTIAAVLAIIKPILATDKKIEQLSAMYTQHTESYCNLQKLVRKIETDKNINDTSEYMHNEICSALYSLAKNDDSCPNKKLIKKLTDEVNSEIPPESLWMPE